MIDITLLILLILFPVFIIIIGWRLIAYYLSDDFQKGFIWGKIVFLLCITVAISAICFFPLDVSNAGAMVGCDAGTAECGGFNFTIIWYSLFVLLVVLLVAVLPFTVFFYETMDIDTPPLGKRLQTACSYSILAVIAVSAVTFIFCLFIKKTDIPIVDYVVSAENTFLVGGNDTLSFIEPTTIEVMNKSMLSDMEMSAANLLTPNSTSLEVEVSGMVSMIAFFCILGWLFFAIFAGIGIIGLPYKLIYGFINRPTYMPKEKFNEEKREIGVRIQGLIAQGESISKMMENSKNGNFSWKEKRRLRKEAKKATEDYRQQCKELDEDYLKLRAEHLNYKENNPLIPFAKLILGILSIIASIIWLLQLALYVFPIQFTGRSYAPFMNTMFIKLNRFFPMIASAMLLAFSLYFMFCTINGAFSFGLRMFMINVHEMEPHDTLITSLVFNGGLILLTILPLLQFCSKAFGDYAANSEVVGIFGVQIENLKYLSWLFRNNVFMWIMLVFIILSAIYYTFRKSDKARKMKKTMDKLKAEDKHGIELKRIKEDRDKKDMA